MKKNKFKPLNFKPFDMAEITMDCRVNPYTGEFGIMFSGQVINMKDYDFRNNPEMFYKFLLTAICISTSNAKEYRQCQDYIMKHYKKWF